MNDGVRVGYDGSRNWAWRKKCPPASRRWELGLRDEGQTDRQTDRQTNRQTQMQTRQTNRQTEKQIDTAQGRTDRKKKRQTDKNDIRK